MEYQVPDQYNGPVIGAHLTVKQGDRLNRAFALHGGSRSDVVRALMMRWADVLLAEDCGCGSFPVRDCPGLTQRVRCQQHPDPALDKFRAKK